MTKTEWISRAEAGRRLDVSATMVTKYVQRGAPAGEDKRVPWPAIRAWVASNIIPARSGSWASHNRAVARAELTEFGRGYLYAHQSIRSHFAPLLGGGFPGADAITRIGILALLDWLLVGWIDQPEGVELPPIDWGKFTDVSSDEARRVFQEFQGWFASND